MLWFIILLFKVSEKLSKIQKKKKRKFNNASNVEILWKLIMYSWVYAKKKNKNKKWQRWKRKLKAYEVLLSELKYTHACISIPILIYRMWRK